MFGMLTLSFPFNMCKVLSPGQMRKRVAERWKADVCLIRRQNENKGYEGMDA